MFSGGFRGSVGVGAKGSSAVMGTSSRTVRGIPGNIMVLLFQNNYEHATLIAVLTLTMNIKQITISIIFLSSYHHCLPQAPQNSTHYTGSTQVNIPVL